MRFPETLVPAGENLYQRSKDLRGLIERGAFNASLTTYGKSYFTPEPVIGTNCIVAVVEPLKLCGQADSTVIIAYDSYRSYADRLPLADRETLRDIAKRATNNKFGVDWEEGAEILGYDGFSRSSFNDIYTRIINDDEPDTPLDIGTHCNEIGIFAAALHKLGQIRHFQTET